MQIFLFFCLFNHILLSSKYLSFAAPSVFGRAYRFPCKAEKYHAAKIHDSRGVIPLFASLYIIPPMPGFGIAAGIGFSSFLSTITHSVVRNMPAIEAAFSSATRVTFAGSTTPAASMFS